MTLVRGDRLSPAQRSYVLEAYIYRWTFENRHRGHAYGRCPCCGVVGGEPSDKPERIPCRQRHPTMPLVTDAIWLREHAFWITKAGHHAQNRHYAEPASMVDDI